MSLLAVLSSIGWDYALLAWLAYYDTHLWFTLVAMLGVAGLHVASARSTVAWCMCVYMM